MQTVCAAERGSLLLALTGVCLTGQTADIVEDAASRMAKKLLSLIPSSVTVICVTLSKLLFE